MMMLVIPVIPHHHHADGLICMKNEMTTDCCEHHHDPFDGHHCCNTTGCVTHYFIQQTPDSHETNLHSDAAEVIILFIEPLSKLLLLSESDFKRQNNVYIETLHGTFITRATGLRAPPSVLV